jgi:triacylglycerol lipase
VIDVTKRKEVFAFNGELALLLAVMSYQAYMVQEADVFSLPAGFVLNGAVTSYAGEAFGYIAESKEMIVVAFRGTKTLTNVSSYLDAVQIPYPYVENCGKTHRGITRIYQTFRHKIIQNIKQLSTEKQIVVTGHSLGGSLAALLTMDITVNTAFKNPILYSFASLPIADDVFTKKFYRAVKNSIRIVNVHDAISNCMTPIFFRNKPLLNLPIGREFQLNFNHNHFIQNHRMLSYIHFLIKKYPNAHEEVCKRNPGFCPDVSIYE